LAALCAISSPDSSWLWLIPTVSGIFLLEVAKNASGEIFDWDSGTDQRVRDKDRSPFSGGKRVLVDGLLTRVETRNIAAACYALSIAVGLGIALFRDTRVLWFGLAGSSLAYFYHARPLQLSYRGWGEAAVSLCYGPLIACGTCLVLTGEISRQAFGLSIPLGLLTGAFLWINEFPDFEADKASGKNTWVVRLGRRNASRAYVGIVCLAFLLLLLQAVLWRNPALLAGLAGAIPSVRASRTLLRHPHDTAMLIPAQANSLIAFLLYALGAGIGSALAP
jgi:1,4-dihydroxy-2-naphthoate octaprenyltransferase